VALRYRGRLRGGGAAKVLSRGAEILPSDQSNKDKEIQCEAGTRAVHPWFEEARNRRNVAVEQLGAGGLAR